MVEVDFLQTGIKLGSGEIDVAYRLLERNGDRWLVSVEAKGRRERIWVPQVARAAQALWTTVTTATAAGTLGVRGVIPFAIKIVGDSVVHTVEFDPNGGAQLAVVSEATIKLEPGVEGIN